MRTTVRAAGITAALNGQINTRMSIPELLVWQGTGKRQFCTAYFHLFLRICIFQAVILGVSAMSQVAISTKINGYILTQYLVT
jgi:hypothetical protein